MADRREIVRVQRVVKDFRPGFGLRRKRVLHGVDFSVMEGEIFGFVGPNGAGKTTTLKILMGLIHPTSGSASILGRDVGESEFRDQVGFLPENPYFYPFLTASEILHFYAKLSGVDVSVRAQRVEALLEKVNLSHAANSRLREFSKGMLQRVGVAQALIHDPSVVFMDEPMSGLDPIGRKEIRDIILSLREAGKTVFMNTHILHDVEMICDRVAIIANGRIRHQGSIEEFLPDTEGPSSVVFSAVSPDLALSLEDRFELTLRGHGDRIETDVPAKQVQAVLTTAQQHGAEILSLTPHRHSLEEVFLSTVHEAEAQESARRSGPGPEDTE